MAGAASSPSATVCSAARCATRRGQVRIGARKAAWPPLARLAARDAGRTRAATLSMAARR